MIALLRGVGFLAKRSWMSVAKEAYRAPEAVKGFVDGAFGYKAEVFLAATLNIMVREI